MPTWLLHALFVVAVAGGELYLLRIARRHTSPKRWTFFETLEPRFVEDIEIRAHSGLPPAWEHYRNEIDRQFEPIDERLRSLATAALALGLAGTIGALILSLVLTALQGESVEPWELLSGMGIALGGSFVGVVAHLLISLWSLPTAEEAFVREADELVAKLEQNAREHPPHDVLSDMVRQELRELRTVLDQGVTSGLTAAMAGFPTVVEALGERMEQLARLVEAQQEGGQKAAAEMKVAASLVATAANAMAPSAKSLAEVADDLLALPHRFAGFLAAGRHHWLEQLHEEQRASRDHLRALVQDLVERSESREQELSDRVLGVTQAVENLPPRITREIHGMSQELGTRFGSEAASHVAEVRAALARGQEKLREEIAGHEQEWRRNIGTTVSEVVSALGQQAKEQLAGPLAHAVEELASKERSLVQVAAQLENHQEEWNEARAEALDGWRRVATRLEAATDQLAQGETGLVSAGAALKEAGEALKLVSRDQESGNDQFESVLQGRIEPQLETLRSICEEIRSLLEGLSQREQPTPSDHVDRVLEAQAHLIRELITSLTADWQDDLSDPSDQRRLSA